MGEAEAERAARVGVAQALAIEEQVRSYGGPQLQLTQQVMSRFAEAIEQSRVDVVPKIVVSGASGGQGPAGSSLFEALLAVLLSERLGEKATAKTQPRDPKMEAYRNEVRSSLLSSLGSDGTKAPG